MVIYEPGKVSIAALHRDRHAGRRAAWLDIIGRGRVRVVLFDR